MKRPTRKEYSPMHSGISEYVEDLERYTDYLEQKIVNDNITNHVCSATKCMSCEADIKKDEGLLFCANCGV